MMYVFGIDMPIMEILFVLTLAIFFLFLLTLYLLMRLTKDLRMEDKDLQVLSKYMKHDETDVGEAELLEFVQTALKQGHTRPGIKRHLLSYGHDEDTISKVFHKIK